MTKNRLFIDFFLWRGIVNFPEKNYIQDPQFAANVFKYDIETE